MQQWIIFTLIDVFLLKITKCQEVIVNSGFHCITVVLFFTTKTLHRLFNSRACNCLKSESINKSEIFYLLVMYLQIIKLKKEMYSYKLSLI